MAKNIQNVRFLRNGSLFASHAEALSALNTKGSSASTEQDGTIILARYTDEKNDVKTLAGLVYATENSSSITIIDIEDASSEVDELRQEINAKLGTTFISSGNTVEANLTALSGNAQSTSAETSVAGAKKYAKEYTDSEIGKLEFTGVTTGDAVVVTNVTETDGRVSANTANVGGLKLTDYELGSDSGAVAASDSINEAFSKVEKQIANVNYVVNALDASSVSGDSKVVIDVTQENGQITATAGNLTGVKLGGLTDGANSKIAATNTLGEALANIQAQINAMDKSADVVAGQVVTTVTEEDGKVTETKANVKDLQLGGYAKDTTATGDIASTDTINAALSKLENKAAAVTIGNTDGSINVTPGASGTDINVNIKSGDPILSKSAGSGITSTLNLVKITDELPATVKERYQLQGIGGAKIGADIDIAKDSHIVSITYITDSGDTHYQNLEYKYIDASGATKTEYVDISSLVLEAEFASGTTVENHVVRGVVDSTSEKDSQGTPVDFLTVGADGFKISGIKDEIDRKINTLNVTAGTQTIATDKHVAVEVVEANGLITAVTVTEDNIADADDLAELSGKTITAITSTNGSITASISNEAGNKTADIQTDASKVKMSGFTAGESGFTAITESSTVTEAVEAIEAVTIANKKATDDELNSFDGRLDVVEDKYISGVSVNGKAVTVTGKVAPISINASASAGTTSDGKAIVVTTDQNTGAITLALGYADCGYYDE